MNPIRLQWRGVVALLVWCVAATAAAQGGPSIILATTTSTQDSGLLDEYPRQDLVAFAEMVQPERKRLLRRERRSLGDRCGDFDRTTDE